MTVERAITIARAAGALLVLAVLGTAAGSAAAATGHHAAAETCGDVVVQFKPEGSGGAHNIRATGVACERARELAETCVKGKVAEDWTVVTWRKTLMTKGDKRISYTPVGGGGCGAFPKSCDDFAYRGVGFFNMRVLGVGCKKGKRKARAWYDSGGTCRFGETCDVGEYSCTGNAKTGNVECVRPDGYRVRWQMGE